MPSLLSWPVLFGQVAGAADAAARPWYENTAVMLLIAVAALVVPFLLGTLLARWLRVPDMRFRIGVVLLAVIASTVIVVFGWPPKLGIDLSGGVILVYEVDQQKKQETASVDMDKLVAAVSRRVNPGGQKEVVVRRYGNEQIEIIVPSIDEAEVRALKKIVSSSGLLEFRITANPIDHERIIKRAQAKENEREREIREGDRAVARWVEIDATKFSPQQIAGMVVREQVKGKPQVLVILDPYNVDGKYLARAAASYDQSAHPCVNFGFNAAGAQRFGKLTSSNLPDPGTGRERQLGILLDEVLLSAPNIKSAIWEDGQITGNFSQEEVDFLVGVLNAGSLPAALNPQPISENYIGPQLGSDTIQSASRAMLISVVLVPLFMMVYYRFSGFVASVAVLLNVLLVVAIMLVLKAAFTLPGLAGLALTVGMAVDANVLIYERMREEAARGATLRMVIRNGFDRAMRTIVDANLTTLIAATVLYGIGTDQVKGFAITLWLGVLLNLFTATFVTRVLFDLAERKRWITKLNMMQLIGQTNVDFLGWRKLAVGASVAVILLGFVALWARGPSLFDIDFTGGTSVELLFNEPQDVEEIRQTVAMLPDATVTTIQSSEEKPGLRFRVDTSEQDQNKVQAELINAFGPKLARRTLEIAKVEPIAAVKSRAAVALIAEVRAGPEMRQPLPPDSMLALADGDWLLAQADAEVKPAEKTEASANNAETEKKAESTDSATPAGEATAPTPEKPSAERKPSSSSVTSLFAGGTRIELVLKPKVNHDELVSYIEQVFDSQKLGIDKVPFELWNPEYSPGSKVGYEEWELRIALPPEQAQKVVEAVKATMADRPIFPSIQNFGGAVAANTKRQAVVAILSSMGLIIVYVWVRFQKVMYGLAAVLAVVHDVLVTLGAIAASAYVADYLGFLGIETFKINLPIIAAFLTIIGYSINDTIVIFDRIREVKGKSPDLTPEMINLSVNQTLSRTILTTFTALIVVVILYVAGGQAIHGFAFALLVGMISGVYSTIYVASPMLLWIGRLSGEAGVRQPSRFEAAAPTT